MIVCCWNNSVSKLDKLLNEIIFYRPNFYYYRFHQNYLWKTTLKTFEINNEKKINIIRFQEQYLMIENWIINEIEESFENCILQFFFAK